MYRAPTLASAADDMTALIICTVVRIVPLLGGFAVSLNIKKKGRLPKRITFGGGNFCGAVTHFF